MTSNGTHPAGWALGSIVQWGKTHAAMVGAMPSGQQGLVQGDRGSPGICWWENLLAMLPVTMKWGW